MASPLRITSGLSLEAMIERLNRRIRDGIRYFRGGVLKVYERLARWLHGRLRSLVRRRRGRRGRERGADHQLYPNTFFTKHGLFL